MDAAPPLDPHELVSAADALLDELEDGWLRDQAVCVRTYAGMLECYGVRPTYTDEAAGTDRRPDPLPERRRSR